MCRAVLGQHPTLARYLCSREFRLKVSLCLDQARECLIRVALGDEMRVVMKTEAPWQFSANPAMDQSRLDVKQGQLHALHLPLSARSAAANRYFLIPHFLRSSGVRSWLRQYTSTCFSLASAKPTICISASMAVVPSGTCVFLTQEKLKNAFSSGFMIPPKIEP